MRFSNKASLYSFVFISFLRKFKDTVIPNIFIFFFHLKVTNKQHIKMNVFIHSKINNTNKKKKENNFLIILII
jgi:hypothetical protein